MRILQISKYYYPAMTFGGPVRCIYNLAKYLAKRGHSVTIATTDALDINNNVRLRERYQISENVKIFRFPNLTRTFGFFFTPTIYRFLRKNTREFDVVHLHEFRTFQNVAFYFANTVEIPYIITLHGQLFNEYIGDSVWPVLLRTLFDPIFGKRLLKGASKIVALNKSEVKKCIQYGVDPQNIVILPNGIDTQDFSNLPKIGEFRSKYGINENQMILYVGRVNKRKGIDVLIKACSSLFTNFMDVQLVIVGADDGYLNQAKDLVRSLNLDSRVFFTGGLPRRDVLSAYKDADVVVCAGAQEGFPMVILEAGIMGKPLIVSNDSGLEFVRDGGFGLTVKYGNVSELIQALKTILFNESKSSQLGRAAEKFVKENYAWEFVGKKLEDVYCTVSY
jgi:glycosyltransferase involved in cell wall biosynthesis